MTQKFLFIIATISILLLSPTPVFANDYTVVSPAAVSVGLNQTSSTNILAAGGTGDNAATIVVSYNSAIIQGVAITPGPGVTAVPGTSSISPNFGITVFKGSAFTNGEILATITFQGVGVGTTALNTSSSQFNTGSNVGAGAGSVTVGYSAIPDTFLSDDGDQLLVLISGAALIGLGILLVRYRQKYLYAQSFN